MSYVSRWCTYVLRNSEGSFFSIENLTDFSAWQTANELGLDYLGTTLLGLSYVLNINTAIIKITKMIKDFDFL
jgi:hypothetical protein